MCLAQGQNAVTPVQTSTANESVSECLKTWLCISVKVLRML